MDEAMQGDPGYPAGLVDWAGHHSGGVKRLFDPRSGRPSKDLLHTNLLAKLESWARQLAAEVADTPRILLLVGGPGNGKTEAIESTIRWLDERLGCQEAFLHGLNEAFNPQGQAVQRLVTVDAGNLALVPRPLELRIVQDATVIFGQGGKSAAVLLIEELCDVLEGRGSLAYLCCVNRGVLDDALIHALEHGLDAPRGLLEAITRAVSLAPDAPSCWPLAGFPSVAVWPMDTESLLVRTDDGGASPAATLFDHALEGERWLALGSCAAGGNCPFCSSRTLLSHQAPRNSLLQILRWYELGSGKRWSFRDLFSLVSYLLAGHRPPGREQEADPCRWAARLIDLDRKLAGNAKPKKQELTAIFLLATSSYQHALFHRWDKKIVASLRRDIKDLELEGDQTLAGLCLFLQERKASYLPATIASLLDGLVDLLDPALASPDMEVAVSGKSKLMLRAIDARFSRSTEEGIEYVRKHQALSATELDLLRRIASIDSRLSSPATRRRKPSAASRIQRTLRDFACRLVRRSICTRSAVVLDSDVLGAFQKVVEDDEKGYELHDVARQVEELLNHGQDFEVSLTTTFGQPLPPKQRRAILVVPRRHVGTRSPIREGRPHSPICFLEVGSGTSTQPIALTYDLFKAIKELERGLSPASLPRTVVALLDTTRARLSGPIVRDDEILKRSSIRIGGGDGVIERFRDSFVFRNRGPRP